ncbi:hypothetical protein E4U41_003780 [Claviceps citrina]|nr:hypothetical protein E4U41_003780 [Claviceps citrina]
MTTALTTMRPGETRTSNVKYYFAYGSNLHMKQMQRRCPNSKYVGLGRLPDFRWQINERGFANVVAAQGHWVDGLVYEIDERDERKLDISEGVSKGAYEKRHMPIMVKLACCSLYRRPVSWLVARGVPSGVRMTAKPAHRKRRAAARAAAAAAAIHEQRASNALVYMSLVHVTDSGPRHEYVGRINRGLRDAVSLGMEEEYIRKCIRPFVPELGAGDVCREPSASAKKDHLVGSRHGWELTIFGGHKRGN